jgi:hypothetical protein
MPWPTTPMYYPKRAEKGLTDSPRYSGPMRESSGPMRGGGQLPGSYGPSNTMRGGGPMRESSGPMQGPPRTGSFNSPFGTMGGKGGFGQQGFGPFGFGGGKGGAPSAGWDQQQPRFREGYY